MTTTTDTDEVWLDAQGVADQLHIKRESVYRYKARGDLPPDRYVGRTPIWYLSTIDRYKAERASASWGKD